MQEIPGYFDFEDVYGEMVERFPSGSRFVEIGVWQGKSACWMLEAIRRSGKQIHLLVVDTFNVLPNQLRLFLNNLKALGDADVSVRIGRSQTISGLPGLFEFVYVDGSHTFDDVWQDLQVWYPRVRAGGVFAGHDYTDQENCPEVRPAVDRFVSERHLPLRVQGASWIIEK